MNSRWPYIWEHEAAGFSFALIVSIALHALLLNFSGQDTLHRECNPTVEIDLTRSARIGGLTKTSSAGSVRIKQVPEKSWTTPTPGHALGPAVPLKKDSVENSAGETSAANPAAEVSPGTLSSGAGANQNPSDGYRDMSQVSRYPKLLNAAELEANLKHFYPEIERIKRNEGLVTLLLKIDEHGTVVSVETIKASSPAFEEAAKKAAMFLKYKPAMVGRSRVAVRLRQTICFKLDGSSF